MFLLLFVYGFEFVVFFCFFKQKTAYEMRISDWSSDVCSSDLRSDLRSTHWNRMPDRRPRPMNRDLGRRKESPRPPRSRCLGGGGAPSTRQFRDGRARRSEEASCRERVCQYV